MRKKIKLTEADVRRLVEKVIEEQCGGAPATLGFADLGGPGMGFDSPIESRYTDYVEDEEYVEDEGVVDVMLGEQIVDDEADEDDQEIVDE